MDPKRTKTSGAIALASMVVLGSIVTLIVISIVVLGISSRENAFNTNQASLGFIRAEGCFEEALLHLSRDDTYTGGNYEIDGSQCTVVVDGTGEERSLALESETGNYHHHFSALIQVDPVFAILDFSY